MKKFANIINNLFHELRLVKIILPGLFIIMVSGCGGGGGNDDDGKRVSQVTVTGVVSGSGGLINVAVSSGGKSATTDANGYYQLADISVPASGSIVLTYEKEGYATFQRSLPVADGESYAVAASLLQYHHNESMDAAQSNNLIIADPNNPTGHSLAEISFPAGSVASSGNVTVEVAVGDPTTETGRSTFPGDYMAASTLGGEVDTPLESVVFTEITVTDVNGTELTQLNEPATVTIRLPEALQSQYSAGDTIPWWSYDETTATWVREDADPATATVLDDAQVIDLNSDGVLYSRAKVTHFSWWNVDVPMDEHACLCVTVVDENDLPMVGSQLLAEGVSYNGRSNPARTDTDGRACVTVKRSTTSVTERVKLYVESGGIRFDYDVTDASEGDVNNNDIFTPTTQGSTIRNTGQCVDLANTIGQHFDGIVTGTVTKEGSGNPIENFTILSNFGPTATTDALGQYNMEVPVGIPLSLFAVGLVSQSVTVVSADTPVIVNFVVPNRDPLITQFTRVPDGIVINGQTVTLNVAATDPDGETLSYVWDTTAGSLNQTAGTSVVWTAPATSSGTAQITVTVTDTNAGQTSQTASIIYNETVQAGNHLAFIIKDDLKSDQPVQGTTVALYNTDNRTIAQTKVSDANGVVDFGNIGRDRATITLVYEDAEGDRYIDTFVNVLVAENIVYYLNDNPGWLFDFGDSTGNTIANIDLTLSDIPVDASFTLVQPLMNTQASGGLINIPVREVHLQNDGKLSMLALTFPADSSNLSGYGYLLDQTVTDGASYDISLARSPLNLGWTTSPATPLDGLSVAGVRNGRGYSVSMTSSEQTTFGIMPFANEFPVDNYWVLAGTGDLATTELNSMVRYNTLPQSLVVSMPDYSFDNFDYTETTSTFSWGITGSSPRDYVSLYLANYNGSEELEWSILMSENTSSWQVMDLPTPASDWINTANIMSNNMEISVDVCDWDVTNGMDQLWQLFTSGESIFETFQYVYCGERELAGMEGVIGLTRQAKLDKSSQNITTPDQPDLPGNSLGNLRRH
ncbi:Oligopeptide ABC transporter, periplasmic oligopeptide-binding protein OppA (TC 3.A.1.5.1) [hydrothermal vent metagenome]|uniref:Oligopeptide ABC transporter, periplasmic oligopeptide-binding protein OppA (TC 3.A.1.5.1) n=1 Tax=hydrothermal vent metagenome TaxID=652676 RepID=A0A3B0ZS14_9ZZZZ